MPHHPHLAVQQRAITRQRGVALFVVIVFVMLAILLALWASRTSLFNEMIVGNDADYQRAFEAAQTLLQDAELDIRGEKADGSACNAPPCRSYQDAALKFPGDAGELNLLITRLQSETTHCKDGLCARRVGRQDFWNYDDIAGSPAVTPAADASLGEVPLSALMAVGARYGQYTGAVTTGPLNPILAETAGGKGGWYWIEVLRYSDTVKTAGVIVDSNTSQLPLFLDPYVIYRITALAQGRKAGSTVVLQETYARQKLKD